MQLMMTSRSAEFKCPSIHLRMKEEKKKIHRKPRNKLQTAQTPRRERKGIAADSGAIAERGATERKQGRKKSGGKKALSIKE